MEEICEHGSQKRKCPHCQLNEADKEREEFKDLLDDLWTLTGTLWEQNETTKELKLLLSEYKQRRG